MASLVDRKSDAAPPVAPPATTAPSSFLAATKRSLLFAWRALKGPSVSAIAAGVAVMVGLGSYFAGVESSSLQVAQLTSQIERLEKEVRSAATAPAPVPAPVRPQSPVSSPDTTASRSGESLRDDVRRLQAQNGQYRNLLNLRDAEQSAGRSLLTVLSVAHSTLIPMKPANPWPATIAYLVMAPGGRLVFVASALPPTDQTHQYQLWFYRKDGPALRGPLFNLAQPVVIDLNQVLPGGVSRLEVTVEPIGGSEAPSTPAIASCSVE